MLFFIIKNKIQQYAISNYLSHTKENTMRIIGLTGGISSGKSTIADYLRKVGLPVIDADQIARMIVEIGKPAYLDIVHTFGSSILQKDQTIDRKKLAHYVFSNPKQRQILNEITHPRIAEEATKTIHYHAQNGHENLIYEVPLLFENQLQHNMTAVILVSISTELQMQRLLLRDLINEKEALERINSQMPLSEKKKLTPYIIDNSGSIEQSISQLKSIWKAITHSSLP